MERIDCYTSAHREPESLAEKELERYGFSKYEYHRLHTESGKESVAQAGFRSDTMFLNMIHHWNDTANGVWIYSARKGS